MSNSTQDKQPNTTQQGNIKRFGQVYTQNIHDTARWSVLSLIAAGLVYAYLGWELGAWQLYLSAFSALVGAGIAGVNFLPSFNLSSYTRTNLLLVSTEFTVLAIVLLLQGVGWLLALTMVLVAITVLIITMRRPDWKLALRSVLVAVVVLVLDYWGPAYRLSGIGPALWEYIFAILVIVFGLAVIYNIGWNLQNQSLRTRLITTFGFVAMLSILGVAYFLNRSESTLLWQEANAKMQQQVAAEAVFVASFLQNEADILRLLASSAELRGLTEDAVVQLLEAAQASKPAYRLFWVVDTAGAVTTAVPPTATPPPTEAWQAIRDGQPAYLGNLQFADGQHSLILAVPLWNGDKTAVSGTLITRYDLRTLFDQMHLLNQGQPGNFTLLTPHGAVDLNNLSAPPTPSLLTNAQLARLLAVDALLIEAEDTPPYVRSAATVVGRRPISNLNWHVLLTQSAEQAFRISNERQNSNILIGMAGAIVFILIASYFSTQIVQPISQLTDAALRASEGDLNVKVDIDTNNELGVMATAFNSMTRQLKEYVNELETRVAKRTAALSQANAQLATSELRYRALASLVADYAGVVVVENGRFSHIDWLSDTAHTLLDHLINTPDPLANLIEQIHPDDHSQATTFLDNILAGNQSAADLRFYTDPNTLLWLRIHAYSFFNDNNPQTQQIYVAAQDITEQQQAQEALNQAERLRSIGVLAGGIAHDFNNLLTSILGQASLVKLRLGQNRPIEHNLNSMIKAAEHAADLTQKLLAYAGKGNVELRLIDLNQLLDDNRAFLQTLIPANVQLTVAPANQPAYIEADPGQIQQVVMNLILNAANACIDNDGDVHVQTRPQLVTAINPPPTIAQQPLKPGQYQTLIVRDTGKGMSEDVLTHIFEPFFTTRKDGRGLGLSATMGTIQAHHGGLHVTSTPGQGTTFTIYLPAGAPIKTQPTSSSKSSTSVHSGGKILVIDDEMWVRDVLEDGLEAFGFQVLTAENGHKGLALYKQHQADLQLVIVDMQMPQMNGMEVIEKLRQHNQTLKIILSSGYSATEMTPVLVNDNALWFLQKPYAVEQLGKMVNQVLQA